MSIKSVIVIAASVLMCIAAGTSASQHPGADPDTKYAMFEKIALHPRDGHQSYDKAIGVLAASPDRRETAQQMLASDDADRFRVACHVLVTSDTREVYDQLREILRDDARPMKIRRQAGSTAIEISQMGLAYASGGPVFMREEPLRSYELWLDEHPPFWGADHLELVRNHLKTARDELREALDEGGATPKDQEDQWKVMAFMLLELGLRYSESDREAMEILVEHARGLLSLPLAHEEDERLIMNFATYAIETAYWHACLSPAWLQSIREAPDRQALRALVDGVDFGPDRHSPEARVRACIASLRSAGVSVGEDRSPPQNLQALHEAVRSNDLAVAFLAGEVLHALGCTSMPMGPPPDLSRGVAWLVLDAWRSVVLGESTLHAVEAGTAPAWDESRQAWALLPLREPVRPRGEP